jgi:hypothetical protein
MYLAHIRIHFYSGKCRAKGKSMNLLSLERGFFDELIVFSIRLICPGMPYQLNLPPPWKNNKTVRLKLGR